VIFLEGEIGMLKHLSGTKYTVELLHRILTADLCNSTV